MAVRFDAVGDYLSRTANLPSASAFTIAAWCQVTTDRNNFSCFFGYDGTSGNEYDIETDSDGTTLLAWNGSASVTGGSLTAGTWAHIATTVNGTSGSNYLVYLNGALSITATARSMTLTTLKLGNDSNSEFLNGRMAAVKVYDAVLTLAEIQAEMRQIVPVRTANLNVWLPMTDQTAANCALDYSGNARNATVGGTLAVDADMPPVPWKSGRQRFNYIPAAAGGGSVFNPYYYQMITGRAA